MTPLEIKKVHSFDFVKIGEFRITTNPHPVIYNGKPDQINVVLHFVDILFKRADESAYIITVNNEPCYVGEYSYSLADRWLKKDNYVWHNQDIKIEEELRKGNRVELWIIVDPYHCTASGVEINISKSVEQEILRNKMLPWNKRGQLEKWSEWRKGNCEKVTCIIEQISANKSPS